MAAVVEIQLPEKVDEQLRAICVEKSVSSADAAARKRLLEVGEQESLKILKDIRNTPRDVYNLSGYITYLVKKSRNCPSPLSPLSSPNVPHSTSRHQGNIIDEKKRKRESECSARRVLCYFGPPTPAATLVEEAVPDPTKNTPSPSLIEEAVPDPPKSASDLVLDELEKLEFRKAFLILNYTGGAKLENVVSVEQIRSYQSLPMREFEIQIWNHFGRGHCGEKGRIKCEASQWKVNSGSNFDGEDLTLSEVCRQPPSTTTRRQRPLAKQALKDLPKEQKGEMDNKEFYRKILENKKKTMEEMRQAAKTSKKPSKTTKGDFEADKGALKPNSQAGKIPRDASPSSTGSKRPKLFESKKKEPLKKKVPSKDKGKEIMVVENLEAEREITEEPPLVIASPEPVEPTKTPVMGKDPCANKAQPSSETDLLARFDKFVLANMSKYTKERARASDDQDDDYLEAEEEEAIPSSSKHFGSTVKKKIINDVLKCVPEGYAKTLRGCSEAHIGPIMNDLINSVVRMDGIAKMVAANNAENKKNVHLSTMAGDFIMQQTELIQVEKQHAIDTISRDLGKTKDEYRECLNTNQRLFVKNDELKEENEAANKRAESADMRVSDLERSIRELESRVHELEGQHDKDKEDILKWEEKALASFGHGEEETKRKVAEAWKLVHGGTPFSYFERRLNYVEAREIATGLGTDSPGPFVDSDKEDDDDGDDRGDAHQEVHKNAADS